MSRKVFSAAMRGRYTNKDNKQTTQHLETRFDGIANCITRIQTDSMIIIIKK